MGEVGGDTEQVRLRSLDQVLAVTLQQPQEGLLDQIAHFVRIANTVAHEAQQVLVPLIDDLFDRPAFLGHSLSPAIRQV